ncbi:hypothetical protein [Nonomuraea sp. B1E8]|uniref:hypothetical protein n=1 Tax=unclassified Nonomuraea TaxID=2593643 RepID=UPI00325EBF93
MKVRSMAAAAAGAVVVLTGFAINAPAASAAPTVSDCKAKGYSFAKAITGAEMKGVIKRRCTVKSGGKTYYDQDYISFSTKDTKCDNYGPKGYVEPGGQSKNDKGCRGGWQTSWVTSGYQTRKHFRYMLRTMNSKGTAKSSGWISLN